MEIEEIKNLLVPLYECTLPFSKKTVTYSPFKVKDVKNLTIILQEENKKISFQSMVELLKNNAKGADVNNLCLADAEYLFLQMRGKSVGESVALKYNNESVKFNVNEIMFRNDFYDEEHSITKTVQVRIKTPKVKDLIGVDFDDKFSVIKKYIKEIKINNEIYDLNKFVPDQIKDLIDNLPYSFLKKMEDVFAKQPELYITFNTSEGQKEVSGTLNFFTLRQIF
jgi:hypothetical protein